MGLRNGAIEIGTDVTESDTDAMGERPGAGNCAECDQGCGQGIFDHILTIFAVHQDLKLDIEIQQKAVHVSPHWWCVLQA